MVAELMEPIGLAGTAARCPGCGSSHTTWVAAAAADNLLCKTCGTCWHGSDGRNVRVDVRACPGCALQAICLAAQN